MSNITIPTDLPTYVQQEDNNNYEQELNQTLRGWLSSNGWVLPSLDNLQVTALLATTIPPTVGTIWYNSDLNKLQFLGAGNTTQIITST
jgi:hypothetical protein